MASNVHSNYSYTKENISNSTIRYRFCKKDNPVTFMDIINGFGSTGSGDDFLPVFTSALKDATTQLTAYQWECPPVWPLNKNGQQFEFVTNQCPQLGFAQQDFSSFREHFYANIGQQVCSFKNPSGDCTLVVPLPKQTSHGYLDYKNISTFTENAPLNVQRSLWAKVASELAQGLTSGPKWLSTCGLGVHYLAIRIDDKPKYYSFVEYANMTL